MIFKICTKCKKELPLNSKYFIKDKRVKSGLGSSCKKCDIEKSKKYREENKDNLMKGNKVKIKVS